MTKQRLSQTMTARLSRLRRRMRKMIDAKHIEAVNIIARVRSREFGRGYLAGYQVALSNYDRITKRIEIAEPRSVMKNTQLPHPGKIGLV